MDAVGAPAARFYLRDERSFKQKRNETVFSDDLSEIRFLLKFTSPTLVYMVLQSELLERSHPLVGTSQGASVSKYLHIKQSEMFVLTTGKNKLQYERV